MSFHKNIIIELKNNRKVFKDLLKGVPKDMITWKDDPKRWSLLEIVCHLHDEEKEDFRARVKSVLEDPKKELTPIDPQGWVSDRAYDTQNYKKMCKAFLKERKRSVKWLSSLKDPQWENTFKHAKLGDMSAELFLSNWLAHDHLHIRQIIKLKYDFLKATSEQDLSYAGNW